jgi:hypothetical protein
MTKPWKASAVVVLALMLAPSALAGITDTPPAPVPPPDSASASATMTIGTPSSSAQAVPLTTNLVVDLALDLLQGALSLF